MAERSPYLRGPLIAPPPITSQTSVTELIEHAFLAYNAARLREACQLLVEKMLATDVTVGMSLAGALTPAGLGRSALIPLVEHGFVDWIVSTGANLYHDTHFGIGLTLHAGRPDVDDVDVRNQGVVRIYDIFFDQNVLFSTDAFYQELLRAPALQRRMGTAELHYVIGSYLAEQERLVRHQGGEAEEVRSRSLLAAAYRCGVPVYTSSPGDSSIGMNLAAARLDGYGPELDVALDVNETAAIVLAGKREGGKSAVVIVGGGSPKNFLLQTAPQLQEVLGLDEAGHDYYLQVTDARPDTGGLSGATPAEAVTWGKVDPGRLPDSVVCYVDATVALPLLTAYALAKRPPRPLKRLYDRRDELLAALVAEYRRQAPQRATARVMSPESDSAGHRGR